MSNGKQVIIHNPLLWFLCSRFYHFYLEPNSLVGYILDLSRIICLGFISLVTLGDVTSRGDRIISSLGVTRLNTNTNTDTTNILKENCQGPGRTLINTRQWMNGILVLAPAESLSSCLATLQIQRERDNRGTDRRKDKQIDRDTDTERERGRETSRETDKDTPPILNKLATPVTAM